MGLSGNGFKIFAKFIDCCLPFSRAWEMLRNKILLFALCIASFSITKPRSELLSMLLTEFQYQHKQASMALNSQLVQSRTLSSTKHISYRFLLTALNVTAFRWVFHSEKTFEIYFELFPVTNLVVSPSLTSKPKIKLLFSPRQFFMPGTKCIIFSETRFPGSFSHFFSSYFSRFQSTKSFDREKWAIAAMFSSLPVFLTNDSSFFVFSSSL